MEVAIVLLIILLFLAVGIGVLIMTGVIGASPLGHWTGSRPNRAQRPVRTARVIDVEPERTRELTPDAALKLDAFASELRRSLTTGDDRLIEINRQLAELRDALPERLGDLRAQSTGHWHELIARQDALEARHEAAAEQLRSELARARADQERVWAEVSRYVVVASNSTAARFTTERANAAVELYGLLAKLETAVATVSNPMLLPGEPYAPPAEIGKETLVWENWKEVGERTFAYADRFSARRVLLSVTAAEELAAGIVELRELLTTSIYPNLRSNASAEQAAALRQALQTLAIHFQRTRAVLDAEFRAAGGDRPPLTGERG